MTKGKRKIVPAATRGKKAPGARKPKQRPPPWSFKEDYCPYPPEAEVFHKDGKLTFMQEKFVQAYIDCDGNATEAYWRVYGGLRESAKTLGNRLMSKVHITEAIDGIREDLRKSLNITREQLLRIQAGMAMATIDDFCKMLWDSAGREENYCGLGYKKHAIKSIKVGEFGNEITMVDKQAALNELWKKLGFKEGIDPANSDDDSSGIRADVIEIFRKRNAGEV